MGGFQQAAATAAPVPHPRSDAPLHQVHLSRPPYPRSQEKSIPPRPTSHHLRRTPSPSLPPLDTLPTHLWIVALVLRFPPAWPTGSPLSGCVSGHSTHFCYRLLCPPPRLWAGPVDRRVYRIDSRLFSLRSRHMQVDPTLWLVDRTAIRARPSPSLAVSPPV
jgi:hypothetical protein